MSGTNDDNYPASELRRRYQSGGTLPDSDLSASQLRSRHNIPSNRPDFSTGNSRQAGFPTILLIIGLVVFIALGFAIYTQST